MKTIKARVIRCDGHERLFRFNVLGHDQLLYAHGVEYRSYIDSGSSFSSELMMKNVEFSIDIVMKISIQSAEADLLFVQPIDHSSYTHCIAVIEKIVDSDSFTCHIDRLGEVTVELETPNNQLCVGMKVEFCGVLEVDLIQ